MNSKLILAFTLVVITLGCTPMACAQSVSVTDYIKSFEEWDNSDWYYGVVENQGDLTAWSPDVIISYYDEDQTLIHSESITLDVSFLGPGEKAPFTIIVDHMNYTSLEFTVDVFSSLEMPPYREFSITEVSRGTDYLGTNSVTYSVKNTGDTPVTMPILYGIYYDASGNFLQYSTSYMLEDGELEAGETETFLIEWIPLETKETYLIMDGYYSTSSMGGETSTGGETATGVNTSSTTGGETPTTPDSTPDPEPDSGGGGIPGFSVTAALVGVMSVSLLRRRKRF